MRKQLLTTTALILALFSAGSTSAQTRNEDSLIKKSLADTLAKYHPVAAPSVSDEDMSHIFTKLDVEAKVDMQQWRRHLEKKLKKPIEKAAKDGMKAGYYTVMVRFLVEKDGSLSDIKVMNDPGYGLGEASQNVLKTGPKWIPGEHNDRKVRSYHIQPITFVISDK